MMQSININDIYIFENKKKRIEWIDLAKGIGIICVVMGHITKNDCIITLLYSFHIPLFFFISGYLMNKSFSRNSNLISCIKKKTYSILIPFLEYRIILILWWFLIEKNFRELDLGPIWFLPTLYFASIIVIIISSFLQKKLGIVIAFLLSVTLSIFLKNNLNGYIDDYIIYSLLIWLNRTCIGISWMILGVFVSHNISYYKLCTYKSKLVMFVLAFSTNIILSYINGPVSIFSLNFGKYYSLFYISGLMGIFSIYLFSKLLDDKFKFIKYLGKNTMFIMAFHEPVKRIIFKLCDILFLLLNFTNSYIVLRESIIGSFIIAIIVVICVCILIHIVSRIKRKVGNNRILVILFLFVE